MLRSSSIRAPGGSGATVGGIGRVTTDPVEFGGAAICGGSLERLQACNTITKDSGNDAAKNNKLETLRSNMGG